MKTFSKILSVVMLGTLLTSCQGVGNILAFMFDLFIAGIIFLAILYIIGIIIAAIFGGWHMDKSNIDAKRQAILDMFKDACPYNGHADDYILNNDFNENSLNK